VPNVNELKQSKFLTKSDVEPDVLVTIKSFEQMNVALESQAPEEKWVVWFEKLNKPLVLNMTNGMIIAAITGSDELEDAIGLQVILYNDVNVMFAGKRTGGIRVRAVKTMTDRNNPDYVGDDPPPPTDDDVPF